MKSFSQKVPLNWMLLGTTLLFGGLGIVNLYSTSQGAETNLAWVQGTWLAVGVGVAAILTMIDYRIFEKLAYPILVITVMLFSGISRLRFFRLF